MKTSELLRKAADEIRRRGWHQGDYGSDPEAAKNCMVCSRGAINAVATGDPWVYNIAADKAAKGLYSTLRHDALGIVRWNDDPDRTVEEVLEKFEEAARAAEREGD